MATLVQEREGDRADERQQRDRLTGLIGGRVLRLLGAPDVPHCVQVWGLWEGHYRVNVLVGADAGSATVAHSFFLVADGEGNILTSSPEITKRYD
jgi:hypothetical protein